MGLFFGRKKKEPEKDWSKVPMPPLDPMKKLAAQKEAEYLEKMKAQTDQSMERWEIIKEATPYPFMSQPKIDLTPFPFGNREYVTAAKMEVDRQTGEVYEESRTYYADSEAKGAVASDVRRLERMLNGDKLGIPSLPKLSTNFQRIEPLDVPREETPQNFIALHITPLTRTGRSPKYPITVNFNSYTESMNGSHGELSYLPDGSIGKADIHYWNNHVRYGVTFRIVGDALSVSGIEYHDNPEKPPIRIYSA